MTGKIYRLEARCHERKTVQGELKPGEETLLAGGKALINEEMKDGILETRLTLDVEDEASWVNYGLSRDFPVKVFLPLERPERMVAFYLFNEWWTRPLFIDDFRSIPRMTQLLLLKYPDRTACLLPAVGDAWKACLNGGSDTAVCLELTAGISGIQKIEEPLYYYAEAETVSEAIHRIFARLAREKGLCPREERRLPEVFRYLGWCSWNAFYTDVNEAGIRAKAEEIREKGVPFRWILIDDGWLSADKRLLTDYRPNEKFPEGFARLTADVKESTDVRWFGVWHALGGYWGGVKPGSALAEKEKNALCRTVNGQIVADLQNGAAFYRDWYRYLLDQGIRFVKVDGQSAAAIYYEDTAPIAEAARKMDAALESGAVLMDNAIINCMGMAMENVLARTTSAVSRNSDDFFPGRAGSFREHLLQNAYNALYHDELYYCDWDMFWTVHPDAEKHALLRAVSGGPVYTSDRVGETVPALLKPLCYRDGELLMLDRAAKATEDCVFIDPFKEGVLKLRNTGRWGNSAAGVLAAYNLCEEAREFTFSPADVTGLPAAEHYLVYDWFRRSARLLSRNEETRSVLKEDGFALYQVFPLSEASLPADRTAVYCLGLTEKYAGFLAVDTVSCAPGTAAVQLKEYGSAAFYSEKEVRKVLLNGEDVTKSLRRDGALWFLDMEEKEGKALITLFFED